MTKTTTPTTETKTMTKELSLESYKIEQLGPTTCKVILIETGQPIHVGTLSNTEAKIQRNYHMRTNNYRNGFSVIPY